MNQNFEYASGKISTAIMQAQEPVRADDTALDNLNDAINTALQSFQERSDAILTNLDALRKQTR